MKTFILKPILFLFAAMMIAPIIAFAQSSSVLQRYVDANPLIKDDAVVRRVQDELAKAERTPNGLNLSAVISPLEAIKSRVSRWNVEKMAIYIGRNGGPDTLRIVYNNGDNINNVSVICKKEMFLKERIDSVVRKGIYELTRLNFNGPLSKNVPDDITNFLTTEIYRYLNPDNNIKNIPVDQFISGISTLISDGLMKYIKEQVNIDNVTICNLSFYAVKLSDVKTDSLILDNIVLFANSKLDNLKQTINEGLDNVITEAKNIEKKGSGLLAGANTGISVANKESELGGGFSFTFSGKLGKRNSWNYKATGIFNGKVPINTNDSVSTQPMIGGLSLSFANQSSFQINFIGAFVIDKLKQGTSHDKNNTWELGAGIQVKPSVNLILGANGFYKYYKKEIDLGPSGKVTRDNQWSLGVSLQSSANNSAIYVIGVAQNESDSKSLSPTMQIIYPLSFNK